jgi:hypothetical protein
LQTTIDKVIRELPIFLLFNKMIQRIELVHLISFPTKKFVTFNARLFRLILSVLICYRN